MGLVGGGRDGGDFGVGHCRSRRVENGSVQLSRRNLRVDRRDPQQSRKEDRLEAILCMIDPRSCLSDYQSTTESSSGS